MDEQNMGTGKLMSAMTNRARSGQLQEPASAEEKQHLERNGQGPYRVTLRAAKGEWQTGGAASLDPALFSGARIAFIE